MGISLSDLPPKAREQALVKLAIAEARRRNVELLDKTAEIPGSAPQKEPKHNKYHAQKVQGCLADGTPHTFDSVKEADRYAELALMQRSGQISNLRIQVPFELVPKQSKSDGKSEKPILYIADFVYETDSETVVEDIKGYRNPASAAYRVFAIKRKLMLWIHGIEVKEL